MPAWSDTYVDYKGAQGRELYELRKVNLRSTGTRLLVAGLKRLLKRIAAAVDAEEAHAQAHPPDAGRACTRVHPWAAVRLSVFAASPPGKLQSLRRRYRAGSVTLRCEAVVGADETSLLSVVDRGSEADPRSSFSDAVLKLERAFFRRLDESAQEVTRLFNHKARG